jgi:cytochrome c oxidase subunit I+III
MIVLILVDATVFASLVFSYFYLRNTAGAVWPPAGTALPALAWAIAAAAAWAASSALFGLAKRRLDSPGVFRFALTAALALMLAAFGADLWSHWQAGVRADEHAYGAIVYAVLAWQGFHVSVLLVMALYTLVRSWCGMVDATRRNTFDNTRLFWHYMVAQGLAGIALVHLVPRLGGGP